jgi:serine/threonine protein kinase
MTSSADIKRLASRQWQQLKQYAESFEQAWANAPASDAVALQGYLPPPNDPLRLPVLHELIKIDLEARWKRGQPIQLEQYVQQFPELGPVETIPADLIYEEYRVRQRYGDRPALAAYLPRFRQQYAALLKLADESPVTLEKADASTPSQHTLAPPIPPAASPLRQPEVLPGGYKPIKLIGSGTFADVWSAEAPGGVKVAYKIIRRSLQDQDAQNELQALQLIRNQQHPYLVQTHAYWALEDRLTIAMELADCNLIDWQKQCRAEGGISLHELLRIFDEAAEGLDFLHDKKVLHRDIKPANILLKERHAKVADFGLAHYHEAQRSGTAPQAGTMLYMAPEVWNGRVSPHSDQYSLALTYAELRLDRRIITPRDMFGVMQAHLTGEFDLNGLAEPEQQVVLKALSKSTSQRFTCCREFVQALWAALARELKKTSPNLEKLPPDRSESGGLVARTLHPSDSAIRSGSVAWRDQGSATAPMPPRRRWSWALGGGVLAGVLVALIAVVGPKIIRRPPPPPPEVSWLPPQARKADDAQVETTPSGERLYDHILVQAPNGPEVSFRLVPGKEGSVRPFYIMECKVWNELYSRAVAGAKFQKELERYRQTADWLVHKEPPAYQPGEERLPFLKAKVTEAACFARWLGGNLPTVQQWDTAAGYYDQPRQEGPYRGTWTADAPLGIAVNRDAAAPVGESADDVSPYLCRDMAGNGLEWTRNAEGSRFVPVDKPQPAMSVDVRGHGFVYDRPFQFAEIDEGNKNRLYDDSAGFRVVLEP